MNRKKIVAVSTRCRAMLPLNRLYGHSYTYVFIAFLFHFFSLLFLYFLSCSHVTYLISRQGTGL